jgi:hypothetical protein
VGVAMMQQMEVEEVGCRLGVSRSPENMRDAHSLEEWRKTLSVWYIRSLIFGLGG